MITRTETCSSCRWWDGYVDHGYCHQQPPAVIVDEGVVGVRFPNTDPDDWCAQWLGKPRGAEAPHA